MELRALRPSDDRSGFQSGDEALDRFFRRYAGQNQFRHHLGVTYIAIASPGFAGERSNAEALRRSIASPGFAEERSNAEALRRSIDDNRILGFVTVAPRHIDMEDLPERIQKKLRNYPVPVLGLARLAVDKSARSMGLGSQLLRLVFKLATKLADEVGCAGVVVDAKPGAVEFYAKYGFTSFEAIEGQSEARPRSTAMWLPIQVLQASSP